jgi:asparagine synthase (glutamine-hydrolysing)
MSMAHGLEVRVPLLDHHFIEACATIPGSLKLSGFTTKAVLRSAMRGVLPDVILARGKQGYSIPIKNWIRNELQDYTIDTIHGSPLIGELFDRRFIGQLFEEHLAHRANHNHVLWGLLNLAIWHRQFVESTVPRQVRPF